MNHSNHCGFSRLFESVWSTFKSNYLLCLGMMVPIVLLLLVTLISRLGVGIWATGDETEVLAGQIASIATWFLFSSLVVSPIAAYLLYRIVRRVRQGPGACAGRYIQIVILALMGNACLLPGVAIIAASNANQFVQMELGWDLITDALQLSKDNQKEREANAAENKKAKQDATAEQQKDLAKIKETQRQLNIVKSSRNNGLMIGGTLVMFVGLVFLLTWLPWSTMASLDPKENKSDVPSAIRRGREIAAGNLWPIVGVYIVVIVIAAVSTAACFLPGLFFGIPLALALIPGLYLCLRGDLARIDT
ncbi:MAG: hypothetical protein P8I91_07005 [Phycisphaerales bacterium]|nr:hypothetical protein [Phycisphaerales bacterium]